MRTPTPPAGQHAAGIEDIVKLDPDHPGFRDPVYRARRNAVARAALEYVLGAPVPRIAYTDEEHYVWRMVWQHLAPLHERFACREYKEGCVRLALDKTRIPQLADVNALLGPLTGFQMIPVAGLVSSRVFLSSLSKDRFLSTQYIRHISRPLYTPEPDVVHELVGHTVTLCHPKVAALNRLFGEAARRVSDASLVEMERVYWYTMEFGLLREEGALKAYGAGLLSSFGELGRFEASAQTKLFDPDEMAAKPYDPTTYQATLYVVSDLDALTRDVVSWLATKS